MNNPNESTIIKSAVIGKHCIIRGKGFGVFAGTVEAVDDVSVLVKDARRRWYWDGAASLSQLAMEGVTAPRNCKFSMAVESIVLRDYVELIPTTELARKSIDEVKVWKR